MKVFLKVRKFYSEVIYELHKVVWPSKQELILTTCIVLASVFLLSLAFVFVDYAVSSFIDFVLRIGK